MDKVLILNELYKHGGFSNKAKFAEFLGITPQNLSNWYKRSTYDEYLLISRFTNVNADWILTGTGNMLNEGGDLITTNIHTIPLLPVAAQGGSLNDFIVSVKDSECERVISPIKGAEYAMPVAGDSMSPEYPAGSQILIKKINEKAFIDWGKVYVLDTCNGTVIKILTPAKEDGYIKCSSINTDPRYAPFEISLEDIYGVYRVLLCMSIK